MRLIAIIVAGMAAAAALAAPLDEKVVIERVKAGKFEELRALKEQADQNVPFAQLWWGTLISECAFGSCDVDRGGELIWRAALAGHPLARSVAIIGAEDAKEVEEILAELGAPKTVDDRHALGVWFATHRVGPGTKLPDPQAYLGELATQVPELRMLALRSTMAPPGKYRDVDRAILVAGFSPLAEKYVTGELLARRSWAEVLAAAQGADRASVLAACAMAFLKTGSMQLPPELAPLCEAEAARGQLGMLPAMLRHHSGKENREAAAFYAKLCEQRYALRCAADLADYHEQKSGAKSQQALLWTYVAARSQGVAPKGEPAQLARFAPRFLSIRIASWADEQECTTQTYDVAAKAFRARPSCPWGRPIDIPAAFRIGKSRDAR